MTASQTGVGQSRPLRLDDWAPAPTSIQVDVTGTVTYTVETTLDDPDSPTDPVPVGSMIWIASSDTLVVSASATKQSSFAFAPCFVRLNVTAGTGTATLKVLQSSNGPR